LAQLRQPAPAAVAGGGPRLRLLLAEDNLVNQKVALHVLRRLDLAADVAAHGREVLEAVRRQRYDVILMDCQMPELDGYETTRRLRREEADGTYGPRAAHYVVALTANAMAGDREKCLAAGMDDFLTKPMDPEALRQALRRAVAFRRESEALASAMSGGPVAEPPGAVSNPAANPARGADVEAAGGAETLPVLDLAALEALRVPGDPAALGELVELFLVDAPRRVAALAAACGGRDREAARVAAHTLKGSAGNLGARRLAARAAEAEVAAREGAWGMLDRLLPGLEDCLAEARPRFEAARHG
ncbi:MAG: response regulator, partial [Verrucomicrobiota bacterium]